MPAITLPVDRSITAIPSLGAVSDCDKFGAGLWSHGTGPRKLDCKTTIMVNNTSLDTAVCSVSKIFKGIETSRL